MMTPDYLYQGCDSSGADSACTPYRVPNEGCVTPLQETLRCSMEDFGYPGTPVEFVDEFRARNSSVPCNLDNGSGSEVNWLAVIVGAAVGGVVVIGACLVAKG